MYIVASIVLLAFLCGYLVGELNGRKKGNIEGREEQISNFKKELEYGPRYGVITMNSLKIGGEKITAKAEVREIAKAASNGKCKVEFLKIHITPLKYNTDDKHKELIEYIGPWLNTDSIDWFIDYETRKKRLERFLE
jgi:hypothetical protein